MKRRRQLAAVALSSSVLIAAHWLRETRALSRILMRQPSHSFPRKGRLHLSLWFVPANLVLPITSAAESFEVMTRVRCTRPSTLA